MKINTVLFDMDGLLIDSERLSMDCWRTVIKRENLDLTEDILLKTIGGSRDDVLKMIGEKYGPDYPYKEFFSMKKELFDTYLENHGMPLKKGALELLEFLEQNNIKKYIVTSTMKENAVKYLNYAGVLNRFDGIISPDKDTRPKPEPDLYKKALSEYNINNECCIALEDSINGVTACIRAEVKVIGVPDLLSLEHIKSNYLIALLDTLLDVKEYLKPYIN